MFDRQRDPEKSLLDRGVLITLGLIAAFIVLNALVSYRNVRDLDAEAHRVAHTQEVLEALGQIKVRASRAEALQSTYIITGDDTLPPLFHKTLDTAVPLVDQLKNLTADNSTQQARIPALRQQVESLCRTLRAAVATRQQQGFEAAQQLLAQGDGRRQIELVLSLITRMEEVESSLLETRQAASHRAYLIAITTGLLAGLLGLLLIGIYFWMLKGQLHAHAAAARAISEQGERFRTTLASIGDAVITTDIQGRITDMNAVAESLTGWTTAEAAGLPLEQAFTIVNEETLAPVDNPATRALAEGVIVRLANNTLLIARDGTRRPIDESVAPICCKQGKLVGCVLIFRDITHRQDADRRLRDSERQFRTLAESIPQLCWMANPDGHLFWYNRRWYDYTGTTFEQMEGWGWQSVHDPHTLQSVLEKWRASIASGESFEMVFPIRGADGNFRSFLTLIEPVKNDQGQVVRWFGSNTDISEQRRIEAQLREQEERLRLAVEATGVGIFDYDPASGHQSLSEQALIIWGLTPGCDTSGPAILNAVHPDDRERVISMCKASLDPQGDGVLSLEHRLLRPDGALRWVASAAQTMFSEDEPRRPVRSVGTMLDITDKKLAAERIRDSERHLRTVLDTLAAFVGVMTPDGILVEANQAALEAAGLDPDDVLGKPFEETYWWSYSPAVQNQLRQAIERARNGQFSRYDVKVRVHDEQLIDLDFMLHPMFDANGHVTHLIPSAIDITERKQAEQTFRFQLDLTKSITNNATTAIFMMDDRSRCTFMNPAAEAMTGFTFQEVEGQILHDFIHHHHADGRPYHVSECPIDRALPEHFEIRDREDVFIRKNGESFPVMCNARVIYNQAVGVGTVVEVRDITDRKQAEAALRESEALFRSMADNAPVVLWVTDSTGSCTYMSKQWYDFTGRPLEQDVDFKWLEAVHPDNRESTRSVFLEATRKQAPFASDYRLKRRDGQYRWVVGTGLPRFQKGVFSGYIGCVFDVHDRKRLEEKLRAVAAELSEADRRKDEFLATLAHELRNPLAPIRNGLQILKLAEIDPASFERTRGMMERQLVHLVRLVDDLMDVSRITRGNISLRKEPTPLSTVVDSAVETSRPLIEKMGHELIVSLPQAPIILQADLTRLAQVFMNLLNNAAKYSEPNSRIWLTATQQDDEVVVEVRDNGIGILVEDLPRVFDMFSQINPSTERTQGGLGIGLTLVRQLVEMHGGRIEASSAGSGQGSKFTVHLPLLVTPAGSASTPEVEPATAPSALRILVVDDNKDSADTLATMLNFMGYETRSAYDGQQGFDTAQEFLPDVILLDIGLPVLNGYEVCKQIREQPWGQNITMIALTGWSQEKDRSRAHEAGFDQHLVKPVNAATLAKLLSETRAVILKTKSSGSSSQ